MFAGNLVMLVMKLAGLVSVLVTVARSRPRRCKRAASAIRSLRATNQASLSARMLSRSAEWASRATTDPSVGTASRAASRLGVTDAVGSGEV